MRSSPSTFRLPPHWGHDVGDRLSNQPEGLVGSKTEFSVPSVPAISYTGNLGTVQSQVNSRGANGSRYSRWHRDDRHLGDWRTRVRRPRVDSSTADCWRLRRDLANR